MKAATAYERGGQVILHASSKTTAGVWIISAPVAATPKNDPDEISRLVRAALDGSEEGIPHPKSWGNLFDPVLALAGVKSLNTFVKSAKCLEIEMDGDVITLMPTRNEGVDDGYAPMPEKVRTVSATSANLGSTLLAALGDAE